MVRDRLESLFNSGPFNYIYFSTSITFTFDLMYFYPLEFYCYALFYHSILHLPNLLTMRKVVWKFTKHP